MRKIYTKLEGMYVLPDPGDLSPLQLDSCVMAKRKGQLYIRALENLEGKQVEVERGGWSDPVFGYHEGKVEKFFIIAGERRNTSFCNLCKDRLNGITGNCFDRNSK